MQIDPIKPMLKAPTTKRLKQRNYELLSSSAFDINLRCYNLGECGITECFRVKQQILLSGTEAAEMIIRVDDIIKCVPRQREQ